MNHVLLTRTDAVAEYWGWMAKISLLSVLHVPLFACSGAAPASVPPSLPSAEVPRKPTPIAEMLARGDQYLTIMGKRKADVELAMAAMSAGPWKSCMELRYGDIVASVNAARGRRSEMTNWARENDQKAVNQDYVILERNFQKVRADANEAIHDCPHVGQDTLARRGSPLPGGIVLGIGVLALGVGSVAGALAIEKKNRSLIVIVSTRAVRPNMNL